MIVALNDFSTQHSLLIWAFRHRFQNTKRALAGTCFTSNNAVISAVVDFFWGGQPSPAVTVCQGNSVENCNTSKRPFKGSIGATRSNLLHVFLFKDARAQFQTLYTHLFDSIRCHVHL